MPPITMSAFDRSASDHPSVGSARERTRPCLGCSMMPIVVGIDTVSGANATILPFQPARPPINDSQPQSTHCCFLSNWTEWEPPNLGRLLPPRPRELHATRFRTECAVLSDSDVKMVIQRLRRLRSRRTRAQRFRCISSCTSQDHRRRPASPSVYQVCSLRNTRSRREEREWRPLS